MTKSQIEACRERNKQLKQDVIDGKVTIVNVTKACADIDSLLVDLEEAAKSMLVERSDQQELRNRIGRENTQKADCLRTISALRDKLHKARTVLDTFDQSTFSTQEKLDMKDVMADV